MVRASRTRPVSPPPCGRGPIVGRSGCDVSAVRVGGRACRPSAMAGRGLRRMRRSAAASSKRWVDAMRFACADGALPLLRLMDPLRALRPMRMRAGFLPARRIRGACVRVRSCGGRARPHADAIVRRCIAHARTCALAAAPAASADPGMFAHGRTSARSRAPVRGGAAPVRLRGGAGHARSFLQAHRFELQRTVAARRDGCEAAANLQHASISVL